MCLKKIVQACSISGDLVYMSKKTEQACSNLKFLIKV